MKRLLLSAAAVALFVSPAYGQTMGDIHTAASEECMKYYDPNDHIVTTCRPFTGSNIIVTGNRIGVVEKRYSTAPATVLNSGEIKARGNAYVADLLRSIAGVSINRSGPAGGLTQLRLRGTEGNHVLVLVDGIEVSNPNTGEFDFASLRAADVVRVEVLRGEQSALWGSDAIGGVVNIITRSGSYTEGLRMSVEAGSFGTLEGQISGVVPIYFGEDGSVTDGVLSINGNTFTTKGYDVSGLGGEKDGAESRNINIGINDFVFGDFGEIQLSGKFSAGTAIAEFDSDTDFNGRLDNTEAQSETDTMAARITARIEMAGLKNLINLSLSNTEQVTTGTGFQNDTKGKRLQANWAASKSWDFHKLTVLGEIEEESFSNFGGTFGGQNQSNSISNKALAADYRYTKDKITITGSARQDINGRFDDSLTWRAGAGYNFYPLAGRVRASIGTGVKNPTMTELFGFFPGSFIPNPDLIPEKSLGYNIGYDQRIAGFNLSIDYFRSDLEDEIFTVFNPNFTSTVRNRTTKSKREGVELEARGALGDSIDVRASATFLDAKENGVREVRRPEFLASATATWTPTDALSFTLSADHTGSQIDTDFATFSRVELPAFTLVGLNAQWSVSDIVTLSVRGDNLLDEDYQEVVGYQSQGRGVYAGFSADF